MDWWRHPSCRRKLDGLVHQFRQRIHFFSRKKYVVFLCGGANSRHRDEIAQYLRRRHAKEIVVFYAEDVWKRLEAHQKEDFDADGSRNTLWMEQQLGYAADMIALIVESAGTIAELGAFAGVRELRRRMLPLIDRQYMNEQSFINTGPIRWVDKDSRFCPSIWCSFSPILTAAAELEERLCRLPRYTFARDRLMGKRLKHLMFFCSDLVATTGPVPFRCVDALLQEGIRGKLEWPAAVVLGLAVACGLVREIELAAGEALYYRDLADGQLLKYSLIGGGQLNLVAERSRIIGAAQRMPDAVQAMEQLRVA